MMTFIITTLNQNKMENLIVNGVKFYPIDKDNEIEIEREGWSFWLTIEETKKVIDFLTKQVEEPKKPKDDFFERITKNAGPRD